MERNAAHDFIVPVYKIQGHGIVEGTLYPGPAAFKAAVAIVDPSALSIRKAINIHSFQILRKCSIHKILVKHNGCARRRLEDLEGIGANSGNYLLLVRHINHFLAGRFLYSKGQLCTHHIILVGNTGGNRAAALAYGHLGALLAGDDNGHFTVGLALEKDGCHCDAQLIPVIDIAGDAQERLTLLIGIVPQGLAGGQSDFAHIIPGAAIVRDNNIFFSAGNADADGEGAAVKQAFQHGAAPILHGHLSALGFDIFRRL